MVKIIRLNETHGCSYNVDGGYGRFEKMELMVSLGKYLRKKQTN